MEMAKLKIEYRKTATLIPYVGNARTHSATQIRQIAKSIQEFGFVNPVLVDHQNVIIAGHGRVMAAMELGMAEVPTIAVTGLSERQIRALILADNKIAFNAGWDMKVLADEIAALADTEMPLDVLGFDEQELDALLKEDLDLLPDSWPTPPAGTFTVAPEPAKPIAPPPPPLPEQQAGELQQVQPPEQFRQVDENIKTDHRCPSCGFEWSGKQA
jgi:hypothetical protein